MKNKIINKELSDDLIIIDPKRVTITIPSSVSEKLDKIAKEDFINIESMIEDYITKKIDLYDESGIACDNCGKNIKEKEQYYSQESAFCTYEKIGGNATENRLEAWSDKTLCMKCKHKLDEQIINIDKMKVRHHSRQPNFPMHIELENEADLK
jgi:hypothetical protein